MSSADVEDKKNVKPATSEHVNLKVVNQDGSIVQFKIKKNSTMKKLMTTYCERMHLSLANVRFRFDGDAINEANTPKQLGLQEGDSIEVYQEQTGGFRPKCWKLDYNHHHYHLHFRKHSLRDGRTEFH